jgi:hypothetical protein
MLDVLFGLPIMFRFVASQLFHQTKEMGIAGSLVWTIWQEEKSLSSMFYKRAVFRYCPT